MIIPLYPYGIWSENRRFIYFLQILFCMEPFSDKRAYNHTYNESSMESFITFLGLLIFLSSMYSGLPKYQNIIYLFSVLGVAVTYVYTTLIVWQEESFHIGLSYFNAFMVCTLIIAPPLLLLPVIPFTGYLYMLSFLGLLIMFTLLSIVYFLLVASISISPRFS